MRYSGQIYVITVIISEEILNHHNYDLELIITPVDMTHFRELLEKSKHPHEKIEFIIDGFENGFSIGYDGPREVKHTSKNLKFRGVGSRVELWNKVMKEVKLKRYAGRFEKPPFEFYIQSPIGLVPKDNGKKY